MSDNGQDPRSPSTPQPPEDPPIEPDRDSTPPDADADPWQAWQQQLQMWQESFAELPQHSDTWVQSLLAAAQLQWGGVVRESREQILVSLATSRLEGSLQGLEYTVTDLMNRLTPPQVRVLISSLPTAADRAMVASLFYHAAITAGQDALSLTCAKAYGTSGLPLVLDAEDQIQTQASAALITALVAIEVATGTSAVILQLLGTRELKKLFKADALLRREAILKGATLAPEDEDWQPFRNLLSQRPEQTNDLWLQMTDWGIQAAQLAEFIGQRMGELVRSDWVRLAIPLPLVLEAIQLLTSDMVLGVSHAVESSLDATSAARRIELLLLNLPQAQRIPVASQIQSALPQVLQVVDQTLGPLLAKQLDAAVEGFDPQLRNAMLNQWGRQINLWSPWQFFQGWGSREWILRMQQTMDQLWQDYPGLTSVQIYSRGLEAAKEYNRTMEQAECLRQTIQELDPSFDLQGALG